MLRIRVQLQDFLHGRVACCVAFCLVQFYQCLKILGLFLVKLQNLDELLHHARADLLSPENVGKVAAAFLEAQQVANFGTGKMGLCVGAGRLVFFQELAEVRKLVYV